VTLSAQTLDVLLLIPWFLLDPFVVDLPWGGETALQPYGMLVWLGLAVGLVIAVLFAKKYDRSPMMVLDLAIFLVVFSFPISYVANGLFYQTDLFFELLRDPFRFREVGLGLSSFGGVIGAIAAGLVWRAWRGESLLRVGESFAFAGPFGWAIARLGCFVTHDHPGRVSDFFWPSRTIRQAHRRTIRDTIWVSTSCWCSLASPRCSRCWHENLGRRASTSCCSPSSTHHVGSRWTSCARRQRKAATYARSGSRRGNTERSSCSSSVSPCCGA